MEYLSASDDHMIVKGKRSHRRPSSSTSMSSGGEDSSVSWEDEDLANCLMLLANGATPAAEMGIAAIGKFECKTCFQSFPSSQALGGHRTSHKKQKIDTAKTVRKKSSEQNFVKLDDHHFTAPKNHECLICGSEFPSGQALGGHMRRHRPPPGTNGKSTNEVISDGKEPEIVLVLDLNLPPPPEDNNSSRNPGFTAAAAAMAADCYY